MNEEFMMIFGCGDMVINNECNKDPPQAFSRIGQEYSLPINANNAEEAALWLGGTLNFTI